MDYSLIAADYDRVEKEDQALRVLGYSTVIGYLSPLQDKEILDYGCGTGFFSRDLRARGAKVTGVDVSGGMIDVAKKTGSAEISFHLISSGDLAQFGDGSFDHAVSNFVFCAIPEISEMRKILAEIFRVLRKNGSFIMMNANWEVSNGREYVNHRLNYCENLVSGCRVRVTTKSDPAITYDDFFRSKKEYRDMMEEAGFATEAIAEPLAPPDESFWMDERQYPPYFLIVGRKMS